MLDFISRFISRFRKTVPIITPKPHDPAPSEGPYRDPQPPAVEPANRSPLLLVDLYWQDVGGKPKWDVLVKDERYVGAIIKATEGIVYGHTDWFIKNWKLIKNVASDRYGRDWFRGCYHYLKFNQSGETQADYYLKVIEKAGGWDDGDILPIVDVELGSERSSNQKASKEEIERVTGAFVKRVKQVTGREVILYGRGAMRDKGITSRMGCKWLWDPQYGPKLSVDAIERVGWTLDDTPLWQYTDGDVGATKTLRGAELPQLIPGFGRVDASVFIGGNISDLRRKLIDGK